MWKLGSTISTLAQKAKAVAADLETQFDKSVGIDGALLGNAERTEIVSAVVDETDAYNDDRKSTETEDEVVFRNDSSLLRPQHELEAPKVSETAPSLEISRQNSFEEAFEGAFESKVSKPTTNTEDVMERRLPENMSIDSKKSIESESLVVDETDTRSSAANPISNEIPSAESSTEDQTTQTSLKTVEHTTNLERDTSVAQLHEQIRQLNNVLQQREQQLLHKNHELATFRSTFESEKRELELRLEQTKEEAKRRIVKAKERVDALEKKNLSANDDHNNKDEIIAALRAEGEKLAQKQSEMERAVRTAKGEARELRQQLDAERDDNAAASDKIAKLEADLKSTKAELAAAKKGESQASKLELDLQAAREDADKKASQILTLEQQVKELKATSRDLIKEQEAAKKGAALDFEREIKKIVKDHTAALEDLENKFRTTEKEAALREDALRHEVTELRKRWQDAVRRADSLAMDVQSSTAPLMRQLESMERQNRTRSATWTALETKLRQDLEEAILNAEMAQKERNDLRAKCQLLERQYHQVESELKSLTSESDEKNDRIRALETQLSNIEAAQTERQEEWDELQKLAHEGVARVRSQMMQTIVEAEERHVSHVDALKKELKQEHDKRLQLEQQVLVLMDNSNNVLPVTNDNTAAIAVTAFMSHPKKLSQPQGQAEILAGMSLGDDDSVGDNNGRERNGEEEDEDDDLLRTNSNEMGTSSLRSGGHSSFAVLEGLQSRLKVAKAELNTLRRSLEESVKTRDRLVAELAENRSARERLPLLEARVAELTSENADQKQEIRALQEDIAEVRELYRSQLNVLLEEKAAVMESSQNERSVPTEPQLSLEQVDSQQLPLEGEQVRSGAVTTKDMENASKDGWAW